MMVHVRMFYNKKQQKRKKLGFGYLIAADAKRFGVDGVCSLKRSVYITFKVSKPSLVHND